MAFKTFALDHDTQVTIYKRRGTRNIRLSVTATGQIRVSMPTWTPYATGLQFATSRLVWISNQKKPSLHLKHGSRIGKAHRLELIPSATARKVTSRVIQGQILIRYPANLSVDTPAVQKVMTEASIRALRAQAEKLLPQRLAVLADRYNFTYKSVTIKQLKSRWGSCDQDQQIVLNLFLMKLPWELIDYVILHELTHTRYLHHGPDFWHTMKQLLPDVPTRRKALRTHQPLVQGSPVA